MLYLIGLGLNLKGYSKEALDAIQQSDKIYLENYTVEFPYSKEDLEKELKVKLESADREKVESLILVEEAKKKKVALLIYGSPLAATTHITLLEEARKKKVKTGIIQGASVFDGIAETGLQLYKFGKVTSMPEWKKSFEPSSFIGVVQENKKIQAHSLILIDIGLSLEKAIDQLEKSSKKEGVELGKIVICSRLGSSESKIFYGKLDDLKSKKVKAPFCFIIPGKMHFVEEEFLNKF